MQERTAKKPKIDSFYVGDLLHNIRFAPLAVAGSEPKGRVLDSAANVRQCQCERQRCVPSAAVPSFSDVLDILRKSVAHSTTISEQPLPLGRRIVERNGLSGINRLHANLSPRSVTIAENEAVGAIVLDSPSIRLALIDGLANCSVKICADRQART